MSVPACVREYEPMARHTSWRAGGCARFYAEPTSPDEARDLVVWARAEGLPLVWVGRGTNLLVRDAGFPGLIAAYRAQRWSIDERGHTALLQVEAGAPMVGLARRVSAMGWAGLAWAEGLPGTVGGAVVGNAGCYGGDIAGVLHSAELLVGEAVETWPVERLAYGYRTSALKVDGAGWATGSSPAGNAGDAAPGLILVTAAIFRLTRGDPASLAQTMTTIAALRKARTPAGSSCGSVFKNPPADSAGRLIEAAGLKGRTAGGAVISPAHANYIVNVADATAADIMALIDLARAEVLRQFGIALELEVRIL